MADPISKIPNEALPTEAVAPATPRQPHPGGQESLSFDTVLEELYRLAATGPIAEPATPESLDDVLAIAEEEFTTAMDLRRQLEKAFRESLNGK